MGGYILYTFHLGKFKSMYKGGYQQFICILNLLKLVPNRLDPVCLACVLNEILFVQMSGIIKRKRIALICLKLRSKTPIIIDQRQFLFITLL